MLAVPSKCAPRFPDPKFAESVIRAAVEIALRQLTGRNEQKSGRPSGEGFDLIKLLRPYQSGADRKSRQASSLVNAELIHDVGAVANGGLKGNAQQCRHFFSAIAACNERQYGSLPFGKALKQVGQLYCLRRRFTHSVRGGQNLIERQSQLSAKFAISLAQSAALCD
jgi:hypothetical protein